ncbi:MAG: hypothetical protein ACPLRM_08255, partial [Anaerolineae bacterium]
ECRPTGARRAGSERESRSSTARLPAEAGFRRSTWIQGIKSRGREADDLSGCCEGTLSAVHVRIRGEDGALVVSVHVLRSKVFDRGRCWAGR